MIDLLVVGGGPAGLATALHAARAGLDVQVWEPRAAPVDKACGEGLMPTAVAALAELGVDPAGADLTGIRYVAGARSASAPFRSGLGRGVRRTTLHAALHSAALAAAVPVRPQRFSTLTQDEESVTVDGVRARYVVGADGLHSAVRAAAGLGARPAGLRRYGQRRHARVAPWTDRVEVHWGPSAEAYVTPLGSGEVGVALLTTRRAPFAHLLTEFPELSERLAGAQMSPTLGAGPMLQRTRARTAGRVLLVGDAAGYVDALTGEGIALALAQAREAVAACAAGDPVSYEGAWRRVSRRYRLLTHALVLPTQLPAARNRLVPLAAAFPRVFAGAVDALGG